VLVCIPYVGCNAGSPALRVKCALHGAGSEGFYAVNKNVEIG